MTEFPRTRQAGLTPTTSKVRPISRFHGCRSFWQFAAWTFTGLVTGPGSRRFGDIRRIINFEEAAKKNARAGNRFLSCWLGGGQTKAIINGLLPAERGCGRWREEINLPDRFNFRFYVSNAENTFDEYLSTAAEVAVKEEGRRSTWKVQECRAKAAS